MKRLNYHLLTHYPLLWNTRAVWVLGANFLLHLFFFFGGLVSVSVKTLTNHSSAADVGGGEMYTFSVLCAALVLIVWCVFYLRNNAFKSFYRIGKNYLVKEFGLIVLIIFTTISYSQSFTWGVKIRVRSITNEAAFVQEMNDVNVGMVYIPVEKSPYFILNNCGEKRKDAFRFLDVAPPEGSGPFYAGQDSARVRAALLRPDAFSYLHYCNTFLSFAGYPARDNDALSAENSRRLLQRQQGEVRKTIERLFAVFNKYGIEYRLNADSLTNAVFATPYFNVSSTIPQQRFEYQNGIEVEHPFYAGTYEVSRLFSLIEDCQPKAANGRERKTVWCIIGYIALSLSILLLCYRRFSRRVFLISVVGTLVWAIIIGLLAMGGNATGILVFLLVLCVVFLAAALALLAKRSSKKTAAGVLLSWHVYLVPFAVMMIAGLIGDYNRAHQYNPFNGDSYTNEEMLRLYPFSTWVGGHTIEIYLVNLAVVFSYVATVFNGWTKRWLLMPEE